MGLYSSRIAGTLPLMPCRVCCVAFWDFCHKIQADKCGAYHTVRRSPAANG